MLPTASARAKSIIVHVNAPYAVDSRAGLHRYRRPYRPVCIAVRRAASDVRGDVIVRAIVIHHNGVYIYSHRVNPMIEGVTYDAVQVHSPGWVSLARRAAQSLRVAPHLVIRERPGRLVVHCRMDGLAMAERKACARVIHSLCMTARQTCQVCGTQGNDVASPDGLSPLRLCPGCVSHSGTQPAEVPVQSRRASAAG